MLGWKNAGGNLHCRQQHEHVRYEVLQEVNTAAGHA